MNETCTVNSKINGTPKGEYLIAHFEATFNFSRIANLLAHYNITVT